MNTTSNTELTPAWRKWLLENLQQGCTHASILENMMQNNFSRAAATNFIAQIAAAHAINFVVEIKSETQKESVTAEK
jgi:hypothetical protein